MTRSEVAEKFRGKTVAIVGGAPSAADNAPGRVDSHDIVVRVNNYRLANGTGRRCDVFYSFLGTSIRKSPYDLRRDGVTLVMCKCPDAHAIESAWHARHGRMTGVDYRYIYQKRKDWFFCDTYIPEVEEFLRYFEMLDRHVPTTGFSAILDVLEFQPRSVFLTGFDFFQSGRHNLVEGWKMKHHDDPIRHLPEMERQWLRDNVGQYPITVDNKLRDELDKPKTIISHDTPAVRVPQKEISRVHPPRKRSEIRADIRRRILSRRRP